jgi:hypothetical protein
VPYIYTKVEELEGTELVGTHQCVALIQHYAKVPVSSAWRQGEHAVDATTLKKGTAIATFVNGRYPSRNHGNHAAFFLRYGPNGIWIMDQWKHEKKTEVSSRFIPCRGKTKSGAYIRASDNADAFYVIE